MEQSVDAAELVVDLLERLSRGQGSSRPLEDLHQNRHDDHQHGHGHEHLDQRDATAA